MLSFIDEDIYYDSLHQCLSFTLKTETPDFLLKLEQSRTEYFAPFITI